MCQTHVGFAARQGSQINPSSTPANALGPFAISIRIVYAADMPASLPPFLLFRRLLQQCFFAILFAIRGVIVGAVWLAILPLATVWTWRMYFMMGDSTAWWISDLPRPSTSSALYHLAANPKDIPSNSTTSDRLMSPTFWRSISADIFAGQIIAALIVLIFVAVFLLREWISQNARPGVFEDEEFLPGEDMAPQPEPVPAPPPLPTVPVVAEPALPTPPSPIQHTEPGPAHTRAPTKSERRLRREARDSRRRSNELSRQSKRFHDKAKGKRRASSEQYEKEAEEHSDGDREQAPAARRRKRRISSPETADEEDIFDEDIPGPSLRDVVGAAAIRRADLEKATAGAASSSTPSVNENFEFTFKVPAQASPSQASPSEPYRPSAIWSSPNVSIDLATASSRRSESLDPTNSSTSSSDTLSSAPSLPDTSRLTPTEAELLGETKPLTQSPFVRRPPMPVTALPTPPAGVVPPVLPAPKTAAQTPLASPSMATYRAPEELQEGYFDGEGGTNAAMQREHDVYFRAPVEGEAEPAPHDAVEIPIIHLDGDFDDDDFADDDDDDDYDERDYADYESVNRSADEDEDEDEQDAEDEQNAGEIFGPDADADWVDEDDEQREEDMRQVDPGLPVDLPALAAVAPIPADMDLELEGNVEDDMEGAMEAIGMRGPIFGVAQNAALMTFVLDSAIGLGVWLPFTIGKSTALLSLNPQRFLQIIHLPIRAMRIVTDPVVDLVAFTLQHVLLPPVLRTFYNIAMLALRLSMGTEAASKVLDQLNSHYVQAMNSTTSAYDQAVMWVLSSEAAPTVPSTDPLGINKFFDSDSPLARYLEPQFAELGSQVQSFASRSKALWISLALGHETVDKIFAVALGYGVVATMVALYLNILTVGNVKTAGRAVRSAVRQQLLVLKVAIFIIIELVLFPLGCGIMLDICSVWLFPEANLRSRAVFFVQAPITAMFYHWVAGTGFMYQFAILLAGCRQIMRAGAMWFIKDPQDQNFHPIREILDRPTFTQLRKLLVSAMMYSMVVALGVGSVAGLLFLGFNSILPLRWKTREPLSDVPVDLLFLHLVLPYTMHYLRPKKTMNNIVMIAWKRLASHLRLTSYMFGGRHPLEEFSPQYSSWTSRVQAAFGIYEPKNIHDGTFRRVPASDSVALPREMRATAEILADGTPVNTEAARVMRLQEAEAIKAKRNVQDDYTVVYIPPSFRYRIILFIAAIWTAFAIFVATVLSVPILLGRGIFRLVITRDVHDGYSFIAGFYLLWACYIFGKAVDKMDKRRQRKGHDGPRAWFSIFFIKRSLLWLAHISYMALFLGLVLPTLISLVMEFYIILPIRLAINPNLQIRLRIVDTWALGLLYAKIAIQAHRMQPGAGLMRGIDNIAVNGWTHPDPWKATKEIIAPVTGGLLGMIFLPAGILWAARQLGTIAMDGKFIFVNVYPGIFAVAGLFRGAVVGLQLLTTWSQSVRDKEFLVEMRLRNLEPVVKQEVPVRDADAELSDG
ncbi:hypothetical protein HWV62_6933 [Athelia sp. TMB]|nr:hypothetical protein HWV62_6933 [Athelia sp. TMB]